MTTDKLIVGDSVVFRVYRDKDLGHIRPPVVSQTSGGRVLLLGSSSGGAFKIGWVDEDILTRVSKDTKPPFKPPRGDSNGH